MNKHLKKFNRGQVHRLNSGQALRLNSGQAMMIATVFFLVVSMTMIIGLVGPITRSHKMASQLFLSRQSYFLAEAGIEDVVYRIREGMTVGASETLALGGSMATTVTTDSAGAKEVVATGIVSETQRKLAVNLIVGEGVAFHYGIQVGAGGFSLSNNAGVNGNVSSNSTISGSNGAFITGSANAVTSIDRVTVGTGVVGDVNAPSVTNSTVRGNLYCKTGSGNNKSCNTSGTNPTSSSFPIEQSQIDAWKDEALAGGTLGSQSISGSSQSIGPKKINGNLTLSNSAQVTVTGTLWVTGNIVLSNGSSLNLASSYGSGDGVIVVDGTTLLDNGSNVQGSGVADSYVMILSTSNSSSAITLSNNASAAILYAPNGTIRLSNNGTVHNLTANMVSLDNGAIIDYEQGIIDASFVNGPSGGYEITSWKEVE